MMELRKQAAAFSTDTWLQFAAIRKNRPWEVSNNNKKVHSDKKIDFLSKKNWRTEINHLLSISSSGRWMPVLFYSGSVCRKPNASWGPEIKELVRFPFCFGQKFWVAELEMRCVHWNGVAWQNLLSSRLNKNDVADERVWLKPWCLTSTKNVYHVLFFLKRGMEWGMGGTPWTYQDLHKWSGPFRTRRTWRLR